MIAANRGNEFVEAQNDRELMSRFLAEFNLGPMPNQRD